MMHARESGAAVRRVGQRLQPIVGSVARGRILALFMLHPRQSYYVREVAGLTRVHVRAVERQLKRLLRVGLLTRREGRIKVFYQCDRAAPLAERLRHLCRAAARR